MRWRDLTWALLIVAALASAAIGSHRFVISQVLYAGTWWWVAGIALLAAAGGLADRGRERAPGRPWRRNDWLALLAVAALAVLTRLWRIDVYPPLDAFGFEEFQTGGNAYWVYQDWRWPLEFPLTNTLPGLSFRLFGLSSPALRAPFVLSGVLAPTILFVALRRVVALPAAWAASMLLAACRWAAAAARFADEIFFPISVMALIAWLFVRVIQDRSQLASVALAVASADLFYAYTGYRVFPPMLYAGTFAVAVVRYRQGRLPARSWRHFIVIAAAWAVMLSPGVVSTVWFGSDLFMEALRRHEEGWQWLAPEQQSLLPRALTAIARLRLGWGVFLVEGDEIPTVNIPQHPMLDPVSGVLATLAVGVAMWRWRNPWRLLALALFALPFTALAVVPANVNVSRYFVLLVPLFVLIAFGLDEMLSWRWLPRRWAHALLGLAVAAAAVLNLRQLQQLIDHPVVQASFVVSENTVLAAIHNVPAGSRVVLLTNEGVNAFEPSDYIWYAAHLQGAQASSLLAAFTPAAGETQPVYWIAQGAPEAELLPELVALICPQMQWSIRRAGPVATVAVASALPAQCGRLPLAGLRASYRTTDANGRTTQVDQIDPALTQYTIPVPLVAAVVERRVTELNAIWQGLLAPRAAGRYRFRLEVVNATVQFNLGSLAGELDAGERWETAELELDMNQAAEPVRIALRAKPGWRPALRWFWSPPGQAAALVPPGALSPTS
ncbi:MAG: glycosyltransferase family 39 protein [Deltaproteobacteria bacterium]|nr:glycosyltransferase family 39 protein [Deltaproteobacteria bacterium]